MLDPTLMVCHSLEILCFPWSIVSVLSIAIFNNVVPHDLSPPSDVHSSLPLKSPIMARLSLPFISSSTPCPKKRIASYMTWTNWNKVTMLWAGDSKPIRCHGKDLALTGLREASAINISKILEKLRKSHVFVHPSATLWQNIMKKLAKLTRVMAEFPPPTLLHSSLISLKHLPAPWQARNDYHSGPSRKSTGTEGWTKK